MGTVIINGRRYDAVTGLQIVESNHLATVSDDRGINRVPLDGQIDEQARQDILANAISHEFDSKSDDTAKDNHRAETKESKASSSATKKPETNSLPSWIANYVEGGAPREVEPVNLQEAEFLDLAEHHKPISSRRYLQPARTLNRRYVRKPSSESADKQYAKPLALSQAEAHDAHHKVKTNTATAAPIQTTTVPVKVSAPAEPAGPADEPFRPVLTQRQAELLKQHQADRSRTARSLVDKQCNQSTEPNHIEHADRRVLEDKHIEDRLSLLGEILASEMADEEAASRAARLAGAATTKRQHSTAAKKSRRDKTAGEHSAMSLNQTNRASQPRTPKRYFRAPTLVAAALAFAVLAGYGTYLAMPSISIKVAAAGAGIDAKNPYTPTGYSIDGPVAYSPGKVTINYSGRSDGDGYQLTQQSSDLDNSTIREDIASTSGGNFNAIEAKDTTIYTYNGKATWLKGGMLYTVDSNDYLNDTQVLEIASSV